MGEESVKDITFPQGLTKVTELPFLRNNGVVTAFLVLKPAETVASFTELAGTVSLRPSADLNEVINAAPPVESSASACPAANAALEIKPSATTRERGSL